MKLKKISHKAKSVKRIYEEMREELDKDNEKFLTNLTIITNKGFHKELSWNEVEEKVLNYFYGENLKSNKQGIFEEIFSTISQYFKDAHNIKLNPRKINFKDLLYSKDGINFEERIHLHIKKCKNGIYTLENMIHVYNKILKTETSCLFHGLQHAAFDDEEFVVCEFIGGCDKCTNEFNDGEIYRWDECAEGSGPPYHPNCCCGFIDWIAEEDEKRELFPEYSPDDEDDFQEEY